MTVSYEQFCIYQKFKTIIEFQVSLQVKKSGTKIGRMYYFRITLFDDQYHIDYLGLNLESVNNPPT